MSGAMVRRSIALAILGAFAILVAACGGSSNSSSGKKKPTATATPTSTATPIPHALTICPQPFALCAASTCEATGGTITTNDGTTYPAATCTCPVIPGPAVADVNAGNMQGSCDPPAGGVWSIYQADSQIPQAAATPAWSEADAPFLVCQGGGQFAQCWNFACTLGEVVNGQQLAVCTCPIETATDEFISQAGLTGQTACDQLPVAGAIPTSPNNVP